MLPPPPRAVRWGGWPLLLSLTVLHALLLPTALANHATITVDSQFRDVFEESTAVLLSSPTDLEFTPDGRTMFVTEKEGRVWAVDVHEMDGSVDGNPKTTLALKIPVPMCSNGERGLGGIAVHPDHPANNWVYLYYTYDKHDDCSATGTYGKGPVNRLSRFEFTTDGITIDPKSEVVFFETPRVPYRSHNSGDIAFGKDGYLYVTVGDGGMRSQKNKAGIYFAQSLDRLLGKIIRLTDTNGIPPTNPYAPSNDSNSVRCSERGGESGNPDKNCQEIYATGLRNPFRFAFDPNHDGTRFYINDVGRKTWERILEGGDEYAGANYGHPIREGPCMATETSNCEPSSQFVEPVHWYAHDEEDGGAATGGAFVPSDAGWPSYFDNAYLYAEYAYGGVYSVTPGGEGCPYPACDPPVSDYSPTTRVLSPLKKVVSMQFGPYLGGVALYCLTRGDTGNRGESGVFRISYSGGGNRHPKAVLAADPTFGFRPLLVTFDGSQSMDPDKGDSLTYHWDFDGDGVIDQEGGPSSSVTSHQYMASGTFWAKLTVRDLSGGSNTASVRIEVDNTPPVPEIIRPKEGDTFAVGDSFILSGSADDQEDGPLPDSSLSWEIRQHHNTHYHPFLDPTPGNYIEVLDAPAPEDFDASLTSYLEFILTATDTAGMSWSTSVKVMPKLVDIVLDTEPSGLYVIANGDKFKTPAMITTWENHRFEVEAPVQVMGGVKYAWQSWSDGGGYTHYITAHKSHSSEPVAIVSEFVDAATLPVPKRVKSGRAIVVIGVLAILLVLGFLVARPLIRRRWDNKRSEGSNNRLEASNHKRRVSNQQGGPPPAPKELLTQLGGHIFVWRKENFQRSEGSNNKRREGHQQEGAPVIRQLVAPLFLWRRTSNQMSEGSNNKRQEKRQQQVPSLPQTKSPPPPPDDLLSPAATVDLSPVATMDSDEHIEVGVRVLAPNAAREHKEEGRRSREKLGGASSKIREVPMPPPPDILRKRQYMIEQQKRRQERLKQVLQMQETIEASKRMPSASDDAKESRQERFNTRMSQMHDAVRESIEASRQVPARSNSVEARDNEGENRRGRAMGHQGRRDRAVDHHDEERRRTSHQGRHDGAADHQDGERRRVRATTFNDDDMRPERAMRTPAMKRREGYGGNEEELSRAEVQRMRRIARIKRMQQTDLASLEEGVGDGH